MWFNGHDQLVYHHNLCNCLSIKSKLVCQSFILSIISLSLLFNVGCLLSSFHAVDTSSSTHSITVFISLDWPQTIAYLSSSYFLCSSVKWRLFCKMSSYLPLPWSMMLWVNDAKNNEFHLLLSSHHAIPNNPWPRNSLSSVYCTRTLDSN